MLLTSWLIMEDPVLLKSCSSLNLKNVELPSSIKMSISIRSWFMFIVELYLHSQASRQVLLFRDQCPFLHLFVLPLM